MKTTGTTDSQAIGEQVYGRNPVLEALRAGRPLNKLLIARGDRHGSIHQIMTLARERDIPVIPVDPRELDALAGGGNHQGVIAQAASFAYVELDDILALARERGEEPLVVVLDGIEDPQNLGSLIRTAEAAGAHGIVIPKRRAAGLTDTVARVSAGAIEHLPVARVTNISQALDDLKQAGCWTVGGDMAGEQTCYEQDLRGPLAIIIGSEGKGISRLVRERCDYLVRLPMRGRVGSLNAAVAGALLIYEVLRQRGVR